MIVKIAVMQSGTKHDVGRWCVCVCVCADGDAIAKKKRNMGLDLYSVYKGVERWSVCVYVYEDKQGRYVIYLRDRRRLHPSFLKFARKKKKGKLKK